MMADPNFDAIPGELRTLSWWVLWRLEERPDKDGKPQKTKVPYSPWGKLASSTDRQTWGAFSTVVEAYRRGGYDGIGFVFKPPYVGLDLDHCIPESGTIEPQAREIIKRLNSYTEISPSGKGVHVIARGSISSGRKKGKFEMYQLGRYFTVTGDHILGTPTTIEERPKEITAVYQELFENETASPSPQPGATTTPAAPPALTDEQIIALAARAHNGDKFLRLMGGDTSGYKSESEADEALCFILAFYTKDQEQIFRIIKRSRLWDGKWEREDYQERTISAALELVKERYSGDPTREIGEGKEEAHVISEEELEDLPLVENPRLEINLEPDNSIMRYAEYGKKTGDAYPEYHYGTALSLHSIVIARNLVLKLKQGEVFPNIWAFLLGRSTISRKTAAIAKGLQFTKDLVPYTSLPQSYSPEGLIEELSENPRSYLIKDEAGAMLAAMAKNYMLEMRDLYCALYDCQSYRRKLRSGQRKEKKTFEINDPYINIVTATTPETFREYTTLLDLTSGWLLRFIYFYPNYKKEWMAFKPVEEEDFALYGEVLGRLSRIKGMFYNREKPLEISLESEAWTYYQAWQEARESELQDTTTSTIELALWGRLSFYALKLAMLFTVGRSDYRDDTKISLAHVTEACRQIDDYFLPIGRLVAEEVAREETTNLQNKILGTLSRNGGRILRRDLLKALHATLRDVRDALDALKESEEISVVDTKGKDGKGKPATWVILNEKEKRSKSRRGGETPQKSQTSQSIKRRTNSDDITCFNGTVATIATDATFGTDGAFPVGREEKVPPFSPEYLDDGDGWLGDEQKITWLDDPRKHPFLREAVASSSSPDDLIELDAGKALIGYAVVSQNDEEYYERRFWYLTKHDRGVYSGGPCPCGAVEPGSISVGVQSTPWERPAEEEKTDIGPHPRRDEPTPTPSSEEELRGLLRFRTDYKTEWPRGNGEYETVTYLEGEECVAPLKRALQWRKRGVADLLEIVIPWEPPQEVPA